MSINCPHCHGTGLVAPRERATRGAALGKLPPFGREVEAVARQGDGPALPVALFYKPQPPALMHTAKAAWELAREFNASTPGSAMVLPLEAAIPSFRWPDLPAPVKGHSAQLMLFAHGCSAEEQFRICRELVEVGYRRVAAIGGPGGFKIFEGSD